jgi:hypothetical protein
MAWLCTIDSDRTRASASPLTGESAVTCQAPVWPPLNVVNMHQQSVEPGVVQARVLVTAVIPGRTRSGRTRNLEIPDSRCACPGMTEGL